MKLSNTFVKSLVIVFSQILSRSQISRSQMFFKIGVLKNFIIFTGKHLWCSLFLSHFIKKRLQHSCFPVNIAKFLRTNFSTEHLRWLLLYIIWQHCKKATFKLIKNKRTRQGKGFAHFAQREYWLSKIRTPQSLLTSAKGLPNY